MKHKGKTWKIWAAIYIVCYILTSCDYGKRNQYIVNNKENNTNKYILDLNLIKKNYVNKIYISWTYSSGGKEYRNREIFYLYLFY